MTINLGDKVRDKVTGFTGVVIARTQWLNNCDRYTVQPPVDKDGKLSPCEAFDAMNLEVVETKDPPAEPVKTGGPRPDPRRMP